MTGIVVGVDGSESGMQALAWAAREGELHDLPVTAVLAWDMLPQHHSRASQKFNPHYSEADALAALAIYVEKAVGPLRAATVQRRALCDLPAQALLEASAAASLLVVGARGFGGFRGLLLGSVGQQCLHHATCPVAIFRCDDATSDGGAAERIVVGIDGSETAHRALQWAVDEARVREASLEAVHVWELPYLGGFPNLASVVDPTAFEVAARRVLDAAVDSVDASGLARPVERTLTVDGAAAGILGAAKGADLLVVGSRGHGGFTGLLLGSVGQHVAHHAACPVVIVPPETRAG